MDNYEQFSGCRGTNGDNNGRQGWRSGSFSKAGGDRNGGRNPGRGFGRRGGYRGRNRNENDSLDNLGFVGSRNEGRGRGKEYAGGSVNKEVVSNGRRNFGGHKREKIDLAKAFESMKFVTALTAQDAAEIDFEDVDVYLTNEELAMPPSFRELRKLMKQCTHRKRFDIVPQDLIVETLEKTRADLPVMMPGLKADVVAVPQIDSPPKFFLRLKIQRDRLNFINFLLTDMVEYGKLKRMQETELQNGLQVAVKTKAVNGVYVRGTVKAMTSLKEVKVYLQDYGISEMVELRRLVELPSFLWNEPSTGYVATFAKLLSMEVSDSEQERLLRVWETELEANNEFHCEVENISIHDDVEIFEVRLSNRKEDGTNEDVVEHLLIESEQRKLRASDETIPTTTSFRSTKDLSVLIHSNFEVDIQPCSLNDYRYILQVSAVSIKSPDEMVLSYVSGDSRSPQWIMEMQEFYGSTELSSNYKIKTSNILPGRCYAWLDVKQSWWYRVRAIRVTEALTDAGSGVLVSVLDRGDVVEVSIANLMEINPRFCCSSALTFRAHLVHVKPASKNERWSEEAVDALMGIFGIDLDYVPFQQQQLQSSERRRMIASGRVLDAVVVSTVELRNAGESDSAFQKSFGLILATQSPPNRGTVQADLVKRMLARPSGPCSGSHNLAYGLTGVPYYDRDPSLKSMGLVSYVNDRDAKRPSVLLRRDWKNLRKQCLPVSLNFEKMDSRSHIPEPMQMRMGYVKISCEGMGPGKFYVQMQNKLMELDQMMEDLQELGESLPAPSISEIKPGMIALATAVEDDEFSAWCRVIILSINEGINSLSVFSIDFGSEFYARLSGVRRLPHHFQTIPPFCRRVHLDFSSEENQLMPTGLKWSSTADEVWNKMVIEWNSVNPIYYGWSIRSGESEGLVLLESFDQRLYFDKALRQWYPGRSAPYSNYSSLNAMRNHPLIKPFFTSVGIDIVYEKACGDNVTFIPIWKNLQDAGFIVPLAD